MIVVSVGCPAGVGPEVSLVAAARTRAPVVLVGDDGTLNAAAELVGVRRERLVPFGGEAKPGNRIYVRSAGPTLTARDRRAGKPSRRAGLAQLAWVEAAYDLAARSGAALVTGPVSKAAIAGSGEPRAQRFRGHTEWLRQRAGAKSTVMCFASNTLATSLVTTHLPLSRVPRALTKQNVAEAIVQLCKLLVALGHDAPHVAVASLNPHAGEAELLGDEERRAIAPGISLARRRLAGQAKLTGPVGAETAYRHAAAGSYAGVVAMYHDQATIPMKLLAFGEAVNVTMGLPVVRTSVDHGTAYDIAWRGVADPTGMRSAMAMALRLLNGT